MDEKSATGAKPKTPALAGSAAPSSCVQAQNITARHKLLTWVGVLLLAQAIIGVTIVPMLCRVSDPTYFWMAGYLIGYGFAAGAHELIALAIGQPCELRRYGAWVIDLFSRRGEEAPTLSAGVKSDLNWFFSIVTVGLIAIAVVLLVSVTLMFQTNIEYTPSLTISTIIGAAVSSEIVGPHIASIQSKKCQS